MNEETIGVLNEASLTGAEVNNLVEKASVALDDAQDMIDEMVSQVNLAKGNVEVLSLNNYIRKLHDASQLIREAQNAGEKAMLAVNAGIEVGKQYVDRLHM